VALALAGVGGGGGAHVTDTSDVKIDSRKNGQSNVHTHALASEERHRHVLEQATERYRQSKRQQLIESLSSAYHRAVQQTTVDMQAANSYSRRLLDKSGGSTPVGGSSPHAQSVSAVAHHHHGPASTADFGKGQGPRV
jgi:hypothetical protein